MYLLNASQSIDWDAYFTRFIVMTWLLIFPCIFFCAFWFLRELNKGNKIVITSPSLRPFYIYGYFFHNLVFSLLSISMILNTLLLICSILDTYALKTDWIYKNLWNVREEQNAISNAKYKFLWNIIFLGYLFHAISFLTYTYHNLYYTNSYFGEKWRWFISINTSNKKLLAFKQRYPKIYNFIHPKFLDIDTISAKAQKKKLITLI